MFNIIFSTTFAVFFSEERVDDVKSFGQKGLRATARRRFADKRENRVDKENFFFFLLRNTEKGLGSEPW